jgi:hypothetical protein
MIALLQAILCVLRNILMAIAWAGLELVNALVLALGAFAALLIFLLPQFPTEAGTPSSGILGWLNWIAPIGPLVGGLISVLGLWLGFLAVKIALKWVKAL